MAVGIINDHPCVADGVTVTHSVISATPTLFSEDEGVEFGAGIAEDMELPR
jgi:hypothetical protein